MSDDKETEEEKPIVAKTAIDLQRLKLQKLMKNPDKPIALPERPKAKNTPAVPEFVRNVMGSSAGAGSGEFHVYRHLRRKEYARQKFIKEKSRKELLDEEYHRKIEENRRIADEITAKKRAKRLKKKQKWKQKKRMKSANVKVDKETNASNSEEESTDEEDMKRVNECEVETSSNNKSNDKNIENTAELSSNSDKNCTKHTTLEEQDKRDKENKLDTDKSKDQLQECNSSEVLPDSESTDVKAM